MPLGAGEAMSTSMVTHNEGVGIPHEVEGVRMEVAQDPIGKTQELRCS